MYHQTLHSKIVPNAAKVDAWFSEKSRALPFPFYTSFDLRDAGFKVGPVDANIFPAGFNNICAVDRENAIDIARDFLDSHYSPSTQKILLLTEEHTANAYYWDNVVALQTILEGGGREVRLAIPRPLEQPLKVTSASGVEVEVYSAARSGEGVDAGGFKPDLIISNNDFSNEYEEWSNGLASPMNPPRTLGWYRRRKDRFFKIYNGLAREFCDLIGVDPFQLQVETEVFPSFDVDDEDSRDALAAQAQKLYDRLSAQYKERGIEREPFLFVKNNAGTYGLGVAAVKHPDEIRSWNNKARKKMKAAKGGREITEVIIQEGIPTTTQSEQGTTAEPAIYMIGCQLAGGFLRTHGEKSDQDSLNSPGAVFQRLCVSDLNVKLEGSPQENSYGWIAKLSFLAVAMEAAELGVEFLGYKAGASCR